MNFTHFTTFGWKQLSYLEVIHVHGNFGQNKLGFIDGSLQKLGADSP
jgi:hypothetical protein